MSVQTPIDMAAAMVQRQSPHHLEHIAATEPERIWISYPLSDDSVKDGFRDLTFLQHAKAVNAMAWHIESAIGKSTTFETIQYIGLPDMRYHIVLLAAIKTGHKVLFCSHFNGPNFNEILCDATECNILLHSEGVEIMVDPPVAFKAHED